MFVVERPRAKTFYLEVVFRAGAAHEAPSRSGISHLLEHLLFKSKNGELQRELLKLGGSSNAYTSLERTAYHVEAPASEYDRVIRVVKRIVADTCFDERTLCEEKRIVLQEKAFTYNLTEELFQLMFEDTPYGKSVIGSRETIDAITLTDLRRYHRQRYLNGGCYVAASCTSDAAKDVSESLVREFGDFDAPSPDPFLDQLENRNTLTIVFFDTLVHDGANEPSSSLSSTKKKLTRMDKPPEERTLSRCNLMFVSRIQKDMRDALADRFVAFIMFEAGIGSVLYDHVRKKHQLTYRITGGGNAYTGANVFSINLHSESDILYVNEVIQERLSEIRRDGLVKKESEFSTYKEAFKNSTKTALVSKQTSIPDMVLAEAMNCQRTSGCHVSTGKNKNKNKKKDGSAVARIVEDEFVRRVMDVIDTIDKKEVNALTSQMLGASRMVALFGNNTTRADGEFRETAKARMCPRAKADGLRLRSFVFDG